MGYGEGMRLARFVEWTNDRLRFGVYQIRMFAGTIRNRWRRSVAVVGVADAAVDLPG